MSLQEKLETVKGKYKIIYSGKRLSDMDEVSGKGVVVELISDIGGAVQIHVANSPVIPDDLNEEERKKHVEKYGEEPNILDVC